MSAAPAPQFGQLYRSLAITVVLPLALVLVLQHLFGVPAVQALAIAAVIPVVDVLAGWIRERKLHPLGAFMIVIIGAGIVLSLISGDVRFALVKESFGTGAVALAFLGSLLAPRPLVFYFGRQFSTQGDPAKMAEWDGLWQYPNFRHGIRVTTTVWGVGYAFDAVLRVVCALTLPPNWTIVLSPAIAIVVTAALIVWTIRYSRKRRREAASAP